MMLHEIVGSKSLTNLLYVSILVDNFRGICNNCYKTSHCLQNILPMFLDKKCMYMIVLFFYLETIVQGFP